jgi:hypothetical protein
MNNHPSSKIKWWITSIRERNYFGYRYYWFNWLLLFGVIMIFIIWLNFPSSTDKKSCSLISNIKIIKKIDNNLDHCCYCALITPKDSLPKTDSLPPPIMLPAPPPKDSRKCNTRAHSGSDGVDVKTYTLGTTSGMVAITFNMYSEPDKMEVYYENNLVASTFTIKGNNRGFVGSGNGSESTGTLHFLYRYHIDQFIKVVLTGGTGTSWEYTIGCPN